MCDKTGSYWWVIEKGSLDGGNDSIYLPGVLECGLGSANFGRKSQMGRPPKGGHQMWASVPPSGSLWWLTAAAKPPSRKAARQRKYKW